MVRNSRLLIVFLLLVAFLAFSSQVCAQTAGKVDVVFGIDLTSSMGDEIYVVKQQAAEIMNGIASLVPDCAFGVVSIVDYPNWYSSYGYSGQYGDPWSGDYAYRTDLEITTDTAAVAGTLSSMWLRYGGDGPQCYVRMLYESQSLNWREGARRILIVFGDAPSHDDDLFSQSYGGDPGRDEVMFTADDLDYQSSIRQVAASGVTVLAVDSAGDDWGTYGDDAHLNFQYMAVQTGGQYFRLTDAWQIPQAVVDMVGESAWSVVLGSPYDADTPFAYLGQLHCHWRWDTRSTPAEPAPGYSVETSYKNNGFQFLALTEHNYVTGNPGVAGIVHLSNSEEDTASDSHLLAVAISAAHGTNAISENATRQQRVDQVRSLSGIPVIAHPNTLDVWHPFTTSWSDSDLTQTKRFRGIEIYNFTVDQYLRALSDRSANRWRAYAEDQWDLLLRGQRRVWATSDDDYTPDTSPKARGSAVVAFCAGSPTTSDELVSSLKRGNFYAAKGGYATGSWTPLIQRIWTANGMIFVSTREASTVQFIGRNGRTAPLKVVENALLASYEPNGTEKFVRIEVSRGQWKSWSQPVFVDRVTSRVASSSLSSTLVPSALAPSSSSPYFFRLANATLQLSVPPVEIGLAGELVPTLDRPETDPPMGYVGYVYGFTSTAPLPSPVTLSITYSDVDVPPIAEETLSIYCYDAGAEEWLPLPTAVDVLLNRVSAQIDTFGLFTISSEVPFGDLPPTVTITQPTDGVSLSGATTLEAAATDDQGVTRVQFFLDDVWLGTDDQSSDGWALDFDASAYPSGAHRLTAAAYDVSGNSATATVSITIVGGTAPPQVAIVEPTEGSTVSGTLRVRGTWSDDSLPEDAFVLLDEEVLGPAVIHADGNLSFEATLDPTHAGERSLTILLHDDAGNAASASVRITVRTLLTIDDVVAAVRAFRASNDIDNSGIETSLLAQLDAAKTSLTRGNRRSATKILRAFISAVKANRGIHVSDAATSALIEMATQVIDTV